jgi:signal peptidase II
MMPIMRVSANWQIGLTAAAVYVADQLSKLVVMRLLLFQDERVMVDGFFKFVHWDNTGAAFSMFYGNNGLLALVSLIALVALLFTRRHFEVDDPLGRVAIGLILGGILGNLTDSLRIGHVVDFLRFYLYQRGGSEIGFPAFNVADSGICLGVSLLFLLSFTADKRAARPEAKPPAV